ncbi:MAG: TrmH family RNA methyltransferase [Alphaproteobacteria bacterium]
MRQDDASAREGLGDGLRLALYQPDIAQNTGAAIRLAAGLGVALDVIGPTGFIWRPADLRRITMDYADLARIERHDGWQSFRRATAGRRLIVLTTQADRPYATFDFWADDILLVGRESAGVPAEVHDAATARLCVPMTASARSLNVVAAAAMVLGEALRQTRWRDHAGE